MCGHAFPIRGHWVYRAFEDDGYRTMVGAGRGDYSLRWKLNKIS